MNARALIFILATWILPACRTQAEPAPSGAEVRAVGRQIASPPRYLPFRVDLQGDLVFHRITFKDVGPGHGRLDHPLVEAIAESLSLALTADDQLRTRATVAHDPKLLDPRGHLACEGHHLYVDLWRPTPSRWGYSLWSGCGESDRFAWNELDVPQRPEVTHLVEPLTRSIAASLRAATKRACYRRTC